jgi:hypothetical protein
MTAILVQCILIFVPKWQTYLNDMAHYDEMEYGKNSKAY